MKKSSLAALLLLCMIALFSCKQKDIEPTYKMSSVLYKLDLSNAEFLALMPTSSSYYGSNVLYKVTTDGVLEEVSHMSIDQKKLAPSFYPQYFGMAGNFIIAGNGYNEITLIRKTDGRLFKINSNDSPLPSFTTVDEKIKVMADAKGNLYFLGNVYGVPGVYKVNTSSSASMSISLYTTETNSIMDFEVDSRGNVLYIVYDYYNQYYRLQKTDGTVTDVTAFVGMTLGKDDNFYVSQTSTYSTIDIVKLTIDTDLNVNTTYLGNYQNYYTMFDTDYKAYNGNRTVYAYGSRLTELNPDNGSVINYSAPTTSISDISYSTSDIYIVGYDNSYSNAVYKIPNSNYASYSYVLPVSDYTPYQVAASNNGNAIVAALRTSDSQYVLMRIDNGGNISTLQENINLYSTSLWKID